MVFIRDIYLSPQQEEHIWVKHRVTRAEILEVWHGGGVGLRGRKNSVTLLGQTDGRRYLAVILYPRGQGSYHVATARDMEDKERRYYRQRRR